MSKPLVSCLMPTANRRRWMPYAVAAFLHQDYEPRELVILDDGSDAVADLVPNDPRIRYARVPAGQSLGEKRNQACELARGEILAHWDDDDWSAPWRLSYQVEELQRREADVCGLDRLIFYDAETDRAWRYRYGRGRLPWLAGSTLCYSRRVWRKHPFPNVDCGEDGLWLAGAVGARVLPLEREDFLVATVHEANTSPRNTDDLYWTSIDASEVRALIGAGLPELRRPLLQRPRVSCLLVTGGRRPLVPLSLACFRAQDYPNKELVIVDEGPEPIEELLSGLDDVRYYYIPKRQSIGAKRNFGCEVASGEILIQWDDDDWFGASRISRQAAPLIEGRADVTALETRWVLFVPSGECWTLSPSLHRQLFYQDVHGGTLAFRRAMWAGGVRYPDQSLREDAEFLRAAVNRGQGLMRVANEDAFVYVRHGSNAWDFPLDPQVESRHWGRTRLPSAFGPVLLSEYRQAAIEVQAALKSNLAESRE